MWLHCGVVHSAEVRPVLHQQHRADGHTRFASSIGHLAWVGWSHPCGHRWHWPVVGLIYCWPLGVVERALQSIHQWFHSVLPLPHGPVPTVARAFWPLFWLWWGHQWWVTSVSTPLTLMIFLTVFFLSGFLNCHSAWLDFLPSLDLPLPVGGFGVPGMDGVPFLEAWSCWDWGELSLES